MISEEKRKEWRRLAENRLMTSALDEYCPQEFLELLDAYEELVGGPCHRTIPGGGFADVAFCTQSQGHEGPCR